MLKKLFSVLVWSTLLTSFALASGKHVRISLDFDIERTADDALRAVKRGSNDKVTTVVMRFLNRPELSVKVVEPGVCVTYLEKTAIVDCTSISFLSPSGRVLLAEPFETFERTDAEDVLELKVGSLARRINRF